MAKKNENDLIALIFTATRLIREQMVGHGKVNPFSLIQFKVLAFVAEKENPTMKDIADFLYITSPSATSIINRLVRAGELERNYDQTDRRIVRLRLTGRGTEALDYGREAAASRMSKVIVNLNEKEIIDFNNILTKIIKSYNR